MTSSPQLMMALRAMLGSVPVGRALALAQGAPVPLSLSSALSPSLVPIQS